jgi:hypothetical protein
MTNCFSSEPVAPVRGRFAAISAWLENLPAEADLLSLEWKVGGLASRITYVGPVESDGLQQVSAVLPTGLATGLLPVELLFAGTRVAAGAFRIIPAPPRVPRLLEWTDGHNYLAGSRIVSRTVKLFLEELERPETLRATCNGAPAEHYSVLCTDPMSPLHEINFRLPAHIEPGPCELRVTAEGKFLGVSSLQVEA